jgi:hypothetical protein
LKLTKGKHGIDFTSSIVYAKKSIAKVMNHRLEKLSSLLNAADTQLNLVNLNEISIGSINIIYEASENNSCLSTIKPISTIPKSKTFKVNSSNNKTCNRQSTNSTQLNSIIHNRIHSKQQTIRL